MSSSPNDGGKLEAEGEAEPSKSIEEAPLDPSEVLSGKSAQELKDEGNVAFKRAQLLKKTTAGKQYLTEAKACYIEAITKASSASVSDEALALVETLHTNLAMCFLMELPPKWAEAKAACEIALAVNEKNVKALFRRAQATLEDNREGLPEENWALALKDLEKASEVEPSNAQINQEKNRVRRKLQAFEEARKIPPEGEIASKIAKPLLERGADLLLSHGYLWGQTESIVHIFVPAKGKRLSTSNVVVDVKAKYLSIDLPDNFNIAGDLWKPVRPDDCSWMIEDKGLVLHLELAKRVLDVEEEEEAEARLDEQHTEHWKSVWRRHPETRAPSAAEMRKVQNMARAASRAEAEEGPKPELDPKKAEAVRRMQELFPDVPVEWGDTSMAAYR